jgi:hypothetical protein
VLIHYLTDPLNVRVLLELNAQFYRRLFTDCPVSESTSDVDYPQAADLEKLECQFRCPAPQLILKGEHFHDVVRHEFMASRDQIQSTFRLPDPRLAEEKDAGAEYAYQNAVKL